MKKSFQLLTGLTVALVCVWTITLAQSPKARTGTFAFTHATIVTVTQGTISNGTVVVAGGKIVAAGTNVSIPAGAEVIDCTGLSIYPGMIDAGTRIGLTEVGSDPRTVDFNEIGDVVPQMRALSAVNPNATAIPVNRIAGITSALAAPDGGLFPGTAALVNLHGYTSDQMYAGFEGVVLNFPASGKRGFWDRRTDEEVKKAAEKSLKQLNDVWTKALEYHKLDSATHGKAGYYPELQALLPVVRGQVALLVECNAEADIKAALKWIADKHIAKVVLTGVAEGWRVAGEIAKAKIPVITGPVLAIPSREYDRYDKAYANAGLMQKAGVVVALRTRDSNTNYRNLPYHAGFAATYGMGRDEALRAITIVPAQIFGVADRLGSVEAGKEANIFITDGDPFETKTQVRYVLISGWMIPLVSRQTLMYDEFLKREPGLQK
ncbi:MAG: amidohydrolase family protein [Cyclobacteriaceae bacterium]|nr:amidohydrolase family protein [Cyclobacteriaceae bacterium]